MFVTRMLKGMVILGMISVFSLVGYAKTDTSGHKFTDESELGEKCNCVNSGGEWCTASLCCMLPSTCCGKECCEETDICCGGQCCPEDSDGCCEGGGCKHKCTWSECNGNECEERTDMRCDKCPESDCSECKGKCQNGDPRPEPPDCCEEDMQDCPEYDECGNPTGAANPACDCDEPE